MCGSLSMVILAAELRNGMSHNVMFFFFLPVEFTLLNVKNCHCIFMHGADAVLEYFLEASLKDFLVWRVPQSQWHPDFQSQRVAVYIMTKIQSQDSG